jgi:hypothetical protein
MAVLMEIELPVSTEQYDRIDQALNIEGDVPDGFIAHSCEDLGGSIHVRDLWESADAFGAFAQGRLGPAVAKTLGDDAPEVPQPAFTELHNAYGYGYGS